MTLTLELTASSGAAPAAASHVFGEEGGTIGRAGDNSWVLPHNKISGRHARVAFANGVFYIEDTSRNGLSVNSPDNRLVPNRPYALTSGDRLFIEPYEITVWVGAAAAPGPALGDPFADDPFFAAPRPSPPAAVDARGDDPLHADVDPLNFFKPVGEPSGRNRRPEPPADDPLGQHYQPPQFVQPPRPPAPVTPPAAASVIPDGYNPLMDEPSMPPIAPPPRPVIRPRPSGADSAVVRIRRESPKDDSRRGRVPVPSPPPAAAAEPSPPPAPPGPAEDYEATRPPVNVVADAVAAADVPAPAPGAAMLPQPPALDTPAPTPAPQPSPASLPARGIPEYGRPESPREASGSDLAALLAGAGVPAAVATPELTRSLGEILRVVVAGLMDVLQSRQRIKEEFRMQQTIFRPADNNPLKFSVNVEDALHNLLVKRNPAYLKPVEAFADAFDDLRDHQLAMLAGMRLAFETMLAEFDPDRLQGEFDAQLGKGSLALVPAKLRYWDLYRARRTALMKDPEHAFERLFGEQFRRAYEEQFRQLKAQRRAPTPADRERG